MRQFKTMLEDYDADHIRRMIRRFAQDIAAKPLPEDREAYVVFLGRRHKLARETVGREQSEIDYTSETKTDPLLLKLAEKRKKERPGDRTG